jgi:Tripartite ATP-independent periplasmic transporter, DctM component
MLLALLFLALFGLMLIGAPVAVALALSSLLFVLVEGKVPDIVVMHRMINGVDSFPLLAVPFFILAGNLMNTPGEASSSSPTSLEPARGRHPRWHWRRSAGSTRSSLTSERSTAILPLTGSPTVGRTWLLWLASSRPG